MFSTQKSQRKNSTLTDPTSKDFVMTRSIAHAPETTAPLNYCLTAPAAIFPETCPDQVKYLSIYESASLRLNMRPGVRAEWSMSLRPLTYNYSCGNSTFRGGRRDGREKINHGWITITQRPANYPLFDKRKRNYEAIAPDSTSFWHNDRAEGAGPRRTEPLKMRWAVPSCEHRVRRQVAVIVVEKSLYARCG